MSQPQHEEEFLEAEAAVILFPLGGVELPTTDFDAHYLWLGTSGKTLCISESRSVAWDLRNDLRNRDDSVNLIQTCIPEEHDGNPFFASAARALLAQVLYQLTKREGCRASRRVKRHRTPTR